MGLNTTCIKIVTWTWRIQSSSHVRYLAHLEMQEIILCLLKLIFFKYDDDVFFVTFLAVLAKSVMFLGNSCSKWHIMYRQHEGKSTLSHVDFWEYDVDLRAFHCDDQYWLKELSFQFFDKEDIQISLKSNRTPVERMILNSWNGS